MIHIHRGKGARDRMVPLPQATLELLRRHLRHSYATHLLEAGVNLPAISRFLGHAQIQTTLVYVHLTHYGQADACAKINALMGDLF